MSDFTNLLLSTLNPATQKASEQTLKNFENQNFPEYLKALATELADQNKPELGLRVAGIMLKNAFDDPRSEILKKQKEMAWNTKVDENLRAYIRNCILSAVTSKVLEARKSAAQAIGALGVLEIENRRWPELIPTLFNNATSTQLPDEMKISTIEAMGYLCENLNSELVSEELTNSLLTAIVGNMKQGRNDGLRYAAVQALYNTLDFAHANMARENERNIILMKVCESAQGTNDEIKVAAFGCMIKMAELYYHLLNNQYMEAFYKLTFQAVQNDSERVALNGIEFWASLCEQEIDMLYEEEDAKATGETVPLERQSKHFIHHAMGELINLITSSCLKRQASELSEDDEDWDISMAGATLLGLIAQCERDEILKFIMPFVQQNLPQTGPENWRSREAGLMAFGKILDGPDSRSIENYIRAGMPIFLPLLDPTKERSPQVRDTAAWTIGVVCELHIETIDEFLPQVVAVLVSGLSDPEPIVAAKCANSLQNLANSLKEDTQHSMNSNKLSRFLSAILPALVQATKRPDWAKGGLRADCYEAINAVIEAAAPDGQFLVLELLGYVLRDLQGALTVKIESAAQKEEIDGMLQYCCGTLYVIVSKLKSEISQAAEGIMFLMVRILSSHNGIAVYDAFLVVGQMATSLGRGFDRYFETTLPFLVRGLQNSEEYQICQAATELLSDISRAVGEKIFPATGDLMRLLLLNVANPELNRVVKPPTISCFGDLALALNDQFKHWVEPVLAVLESASTATVPKDDQDMVDYLNELRDSILETYVSILNSLASDSARQAFSTPGRLENLLTFLVNLARDISETDSIVSDSVIKNACGVLGDLVKVLGPNASMKIKSAAQYFQVIVQRCIDDEDEDVSKVGKWVLSLLKH